MCVCRCRLSTTGNYRRDILRWRERVEILIGLAGLVATVYIFWWKDWRKPTLTAEAKVAIEKMQSDSSQAFSTSTITTTMYVSVGALDFT